MVRNIRKLDANKPFMTKEQWEAVIVLSTIVLVFVAFIFFSFVLLTQTSQSL